MGPEHVLTNFEQTPEKYDYVNEEWKFSTAKYMNQLIRDGFELYPSEKSKVNIHKILRSTGVFPTKLSSDATIEQMRGKELKKYKNYLTTKDPSMRISKKALTTVAAWADNHHKPVMLAEIPTALKRYNTLQQNHLLEMQKLIESSFLWSHRKDLSCFEGALIHCPEFLLHLSDEYMAVLIKTLANEFDQLERDIDLQTIFVVCGYG